MPIFQKSVLNKYLKQQNQARLAEAYAMFTAYFHNPERQQNIRAAKEEQFQEGFLRELFVNILGYTLNPEPNYNLTTELKNLVGSKKADGAILVADKAIGVIELKGTDTTDLDKINAQAFAYKNNHPGCNYIITSNFEKLRFYIQNAVDHIEFNLFSLSADDFALLWMCLQVDNLLANIPLKAKEESLAAEENITRQLYKDYAGFKNDLWQNLVANHPEYNELELFKKTQKLIDRFLFIFFAEDGGLLPPNSISRMIERYHMLKDEDAYKPLYEIFKQYFGYINTGRKGKTAQDDIFAYNGGLFTHDDLLDTMRIDDAALLPHITNLTRYDFQSEVDVNILGHIFENSLNEIEAITARLEGTALDNAKTKRKKDGVFYTPKYITHYIVQNTVGKLCEEKKAALGIVDEAYARGRSNRNKATIKKLDENLQAYRNWLLDITIVDPASGIAGMSYTWEQLPGLGDVYREGGQHAVEAYTYKDSWGRTLRTKQVSRKQNGTIDEQLETDFFFNPLGELLRSENPLDVATHYTYDLFGRMVQEQHDDRGTTKLYYDMAGNVTAMQNPATGTDSITMSYYYGRLTDKTMPQTDGLYGVHYTYGSLNDGKNGAGRVVQIQQGTNFKTDNLKYDELGNVVFESKIFTLPSALRTFTTRYDYDSWGRMQDVTYPDNEFVRYMYKSTGELEKIESKLNGQSHFEDIVRYADYDGYGNMNYLRYGNGAVTTFTYGANKQRLLGSIVNTRYSASNVNLRGNILNKEYAYDDFGRIEEVTNTPSVNISLIGMGGSYTNAYTYDQFNRLSSTTASNTGFYTLDYTLTMAYNKAGGIKQKTMSSTSLPADKRYSFAYTYNNEATGAPDAKKHRLYRVENTGAGSSVPQRTQFDFNANGSIKNIKVAQTIGQPLVLKEKYVRNEEQWLMGHEDVANDQLTHFVYDHTGNRILKGGLTNASLAVNGQSGPLSLAMSPYTLYVNPYYVTQEFAATAILSKHYYMGAQRVATQMAGTEDLEPAGDPGEGMMKQGEQTNSPILENLEHVLTDFGKQKGTDYTPEDLLRTAELTDYYPDTTQPSTNSYKSDSSSTAQEPKNGSGTFAAIPPSGGGGAYGGPTRILYYYHPDYLGNVEYITDADGLPYQYFWYSPWGENLKEENATTNGWSSPYRFNGKEQDEETGLYYYGARYYNPQTSFWLSVDPILKHHESPYSTFSNNPIMLVDPDGRDTNFVDSQARADFKKAMQITNNMVSELEAEVAKDEGLKSKKGFGAWWQRTWRSEEKHKTDLANWKKLQSDFTQIVDPNTRLVSYTTKGAFAAEDGYTKAYESVAILVGFKAGKLASLIHENRHVNQIMNGTSGFTEGVLRNTDWFDELDAFQYEMIFDPGYVNRKIQSSASNHGKDPSSYTLQDMISNEYKKPKYIWTFIDQK